MIVTIDNISQIVKILRFPLAISVVMIHSFINGCNIFTYLLQNIIFYQFHYFSSSLDFISLIVLNRINKK